MKILVATDRTISWMPQPGEGRLYITDVLPPREQLSTAFGFVFVGEQILLTRLRDRDWDIPGGHIDPGEAPEAAAVREVWEETCARVAVVELLGIQELETCAPKPANYRWPYPISVQVFYLCRLVELSPFTANDESSERRLVTSEEARLVPTMRNHAAIYEEGLRRARALMQP
jgi:8-oxo-dGTP diphosphatase